MKIHQESKERYGAEKLHWILLKSELSVSILRVQRLMKKVEIRSITKKIPSLLHSRKSDGKQEPVD
ncbi:IS3 family transposase [Niallia taxi]|uniref:IS3 family transposase n=1 Tax=Niallia taxi TaxID=2499688 RepID=UPI0035CCD137